MPDFDFGGDTFDLDATEDREILRFILSQALYGEATGVYCGKSLYAARTLEAARFYVRQAHEELNHLELFGRIFRTLDMKPAGAHWVIKLLSAHNNYYPLKVLMEHALGEGMVLDVFRDVLMETLPESDPRGAEIKKKLAVVCREEESHIAWGEKETRRILTETPWLRHPFYGILEIQLLVAPIVTRAYRTRTHSHKVLRHLPAFVQHVQDRVWKQGQDLGFVPAERPGLPYRWFAMAAGAALFVRSQFARSTSTLEKTYLAELGF